MEIFIIPPHEKTIKWLCIQRRLRSAWASPKSDQSSLSAWRTIGSSATYWAHSEDWSVWANAQAGLSLRWAHSHIIGFVMRQLIFMIENGEWRSITAFQIKKKCLNNFAERCLRNNSTANITKGEQNIQLILLEIKVIDFGLSPLSPVSAKSLLFIRVN